MLLGAPGFNDWHGTTIIVRDPKEPFNEFRRAKPVQNSQFNVIAEREKSVQEVLYEYSGMKRTNSTSYII